MGGKRVDVSSSRFQNLRKKTQIYSRRFPIWTKSSDVLPEKKTFLFTSLSLTCTKYRKTIALRFTQLSLNAAPRSGKTAQDEIAHVREGDGGLVGWDCVAGVADVVVGETALVR